VGHREEETISFAYRRRRPRFPKRADRRLPARAAHRRITPARGERVQVAISRQFAFPLRRAYDYITDLGRWPEYWPGLIRVEPGARWSQPGDTARLTLKLLGRPTELEMTLQRVVHTSSSSTRASSAACPQQGTSATSSRITRASVTGLSSSSSRVPGCAGRLTGSSLPAPSSGWPGGRSATWSSASPSCRRAMTNDRCE